MMTRVLAAFMLCLATGVSAFDGAGVTVAVIDTGVRATHTDLAGAVVEERCFCRDSQNRGCCPNGQAQQVGPGAARDDYGHGTVVAGIIASNGTVAPRGIAPGAGILAIRVSEANGNVTWTSQVVSALDSIVADPRGTRVVNMSFAIGNPAGGACDESQRDLASAVGRVRAAGILVVAASGNDGRSDAMRAPACIGSVMSVGAVHASDQAGVTLGCTDSPAERDRVACFSNSDPTLDMLAPGSNILGPSKSGGVASGTGTSFAAPHVSAAAAILFGMQPGLTPDQVEMLLETTGRPLFDPRNGLTFPRVEIEAAMMKLQTPVARRRAVSRGL
jgi:subtilisin family serine protease